ncbi:antibiotic biosynthesis monooxygenase family protein [Aliikangiella sp. G2MR2-5]|uniref:antibiotic biosynthesis monooxygenase family protein n=1 Tax=Aliikangiella sp. G2MR2-5 TaxID=2788943 RepID=UPI0018A8B41C
MIIRVFRVKVQKESSKAFERDFESISVPLVKSQTGVISVEFGRALSDFDNEYIMISHWSDIDSLKQFAGDSWQQAMIPHGMEQYIKECWVYHYESE